MVRLSAGISTTLPAPALNMVCKNQTLTAIYCNTWTPAHDKRNSGDDCVACIHAKWPAWRAKRVVT